MVSLSIFSSRRIRFVSAGSSRSSMPQRRPFFAGTSPVSLGSAESFEKSAATKGARPVSNTSCRRSGCFDNRSFVSSVAIRSLETFCRLGASAETAAMVSASMPKSSWAEKRMARSIRSASS